MTQENEHASVNPDAHQGTKHRRSSTLTNGLRFQANVPLSAIDGRNGMEYEGLSANSNFGTAVTGIADLDGDGIPDLAATSRYQASNIGNVDVFWGNPALLGTKTITHTASNHLSVYGQLAFGAHIHDRTAVADFGNVFGGTQHALGIGSIYDSHEGRNCAGQIIALKGGAHLRSPTSIDTRLSWDVRWGMKIHGAFGGCSESGTGWPIAAADVTGDGNSDILAGYAWKARAEILKGGPHLNGIADIDLASATVPNRTILDEFSYESARMFAGKIGRSSTPKLLVSVRNYDGYRGLINEYKGDGDFTKANAHAIFGPHRDAYLGDGPSAVITGDLDGDSFNDVIVGAESAGQVYAVWGSAEGLDAWNIELENLATTKKGLAFTPATTGQRMGWALAGTDLNGDGIYDLVIGKFNNVGNIHVVFGGPHLRQLTEFPLSQINGQNGFNIVPEQTNSLTGYSVSVLENVNGLGVPGIIIGAPDATASGKSRAGKMFVLHGANKDTLKLDINPIAIQKNGAAILSAEHINATSTLYPPEQIIIKNIFRQNTTLRMVNAPSIVVTEVTQAQINAHEVMIVANGNEDPPYMSFTANAGFMETAASDAEFTFQNLPPKLRHNHLTINTGEMRSIGPQHLKVTDPDTDAEKLIFDITKQQHCNFQLKFNGTAVTQFTQANILNGRIALAHDGSHFAPTYQFTVNDGNTTIGPFTSNVNFNPVGVRFKSPINLRECYNFHKSCLHVYGSDDEVEAGFGRVYGTHGDFNGDGYGDLLVGSINARQVGFIYGGPNIATGGSRQFNEALPATAGFMMTAPSVIAADYAGDVNNDGFDDIVVLDGSKVHLLLGRNGKLERALLENPNVHTFTLPTPSAKFLRTTHDLDSDNKRDVVIGTYGQYTKPSSVPPGASVVIYGDCLKKTVLGISANCKPNYILPNLPTGQGVDAQPVGDFNNDGFDDLGMSAPDGASYVVHGGHTIPQPPVTTQLSYGLPLFPTADAGDFNGDGFPDVVGMVESFSGVLSQNVAGGAIIFGGPHYDRTTVPVDTRDSLYKPGQVLLLGDTPSIYSIDKAVTPLGDVTGTGFDSIAISGANQEIRIIHGTNTPTTSIDYTQTALNGNNKIGTVFHQDVGTAATYAAGIGDVTGDGAPDIFMSIPGSNPGNRGDVYIAFGANDDVFSVTIHQTNIYDSDDAPFTNSMVHARCLYYDANEITLNFNNIEGGVLYRVPAPTTPITTCTQSDIDSNQIRLRLVGGTFSFTVTAEAGFWETNPQQGSIAKVANTAPKLHLEKPIVLPKNGTITLDPTHLNATDDTPNTLPLSFEIRGTKDGYFTTGSDSPESPKLSELDFTVADLSAARIHLHSNSSQVPQFMVRATDGLLASAFIVPLISFVSTTSTNDTFTPTGDTPTDSGGAGAVIGGVIGTIGFILAAAAMFMLYNRYKKNQRIGTAHLTGPTVFDAPATVEMQANPVFSGTGATTPNAWNASLYTLNNSTTSSSTEDPDNQLNESQQTAPSTNKGSPNGPPRQTLVNAWDQSMYAIPLDDGTGDGDPARQSLDNSGGENNAADWDSSTYVTSPQSGPDHNNTASDQSGSWSPTLYALRSTPTSSSQGAPSTSLTIK